MSGPMECARCHGRLNDDETKCWRGCDAGLVPAPDLGLSKRFLDCSVEEYLDPSTGASGCVVGPPLPLPKDWAAQWREAAGKLAKWATCQYRDCVNGQVEHGAEGSCRNRDTVPAGMVWKDAYEHSEQGVMVTDRRRFGVVDKFSLRTALMRIRDLSHHRDEKHTQESREINRIADEALRLMP